MATEERRVERWARSRGVLGTPGEAERRVLLESPRARQPGLIDRLRRSPVGGAAFLILLFSGIVGVGSFLSSPDLTGWRRGFDAETSMVVAGVSFAFALIFVIMLWMAWLTEGRERGVIGVVIPMMLLPAGVSLFFLTADNPLDPGSIWAMPIWATAILSALLVVVALVASQPKKTDGTGAKHPVDVSSLSPSEVNELLQLREQTLQILVERGELPAEIAERAQELPLGELHTLNEESEKLRKERRQ